MGPHPDTSTCRQVDSVHAVGCVHTHTWVCLFECQGEGACLQRVYVRKSFFKEWTEGSQFAAVEDKCNSSQGRWFFVSKSTLLALMSVVSGLARPRRQRMEQRESWISQQNFWEQPRRQGMRSTETGQKEVGGKASEQQEDPTGDKAGIPWKVTAKAIHF